MSYPVIVAPGFHSRQYVYEMLRFGRAIRDEHLWQFPLLPSATYTFQQMASGREFKVSGSERAVARAIEWLNNAVTMTYEGVLEFGYEQFLKRRALDYNCVGRTMFHWDKGKPLRYLDPCDMMYLLSDGKWLNQYTGERFDPAQISLHHPLPVGGSGAFVAPLGPVIPTAMLAWLVREHDKASTDGRKIRDIMIVIGESLADEIKGAVEQLISTYTGKANPAENGVPLVHAELVQGLKAADMVTRLGLSNIPEGFSRSDFQFEYVNEVAAALGISLRHFWNSEKATNRALEEVQETRQQQKGPSAFVRTEQRQINASGCLKQFGRNVRMGFIEEVDVQSREVNAKVLKLYAEGLQIFAQVFGGEVNGEALLAWLQSEDILPADLELITDLGAMQNPDVLQTPVDGAAQGQSDPKPTPAKKSKSAPLDYDEITMDSTGRILERRAKVISFEKILKSRLLEDEDYMSTIVEEEQPITFEQALKMARNRNAAKFFKNVREGQWEGQELPQLEDKIKAIVEARTELSDVHHRWIKVVLDATVEKDEDSPEMLKAV